MRIKTKKNILYIITSLEPAGAQIILLQTLKIIDLTKYNIFLAYLYKKSQALNFIKLPKQIKIYDLSRNGKIAVFVLFKIIWLIKKEKIEILHTHLVHAGIIGKIAGKLSGVKYLITTRHYTISDKEYTLLYQIENRLMKYCSVIIAVSKSVRNSLLKNHFISPQKIEIIHNGLDISMFPYNPLPQGLNSKLIIGTVGRLHPAKGYFILLTAFKRLKEKINNVELEIIGEGILKNDLVNFSEKLGISSSIIWHGSIPHNEIIQKFYHWDLFAISSQWEGFGLVIIEAMAAGLAVVASKVDGIIEIVEDGKTGYLFNKSDFEEMSVKIEELLQNSEKRKMMGEAGRNKVNRQFSIHKMVKKIENIYDQLD